MVIGVLYSLPPGLCGDGKQKSHVNFLVHFTFENSTSESDSIIFAR